MTAPTVPALVDVLAELHDAELASEHVTVAHDLDQGDQAFAALAPGYPAGGAA